MLATAAGSLATFLFIASNIPMLVKAARTRDLRSYSPVALALNTIGNGLYWIYLWSLPLGPVHALNAFSTVVTAVMLGLYFRSRKD